jgi:hypothetical protein
VRAIALVAGSRPTAYVGMAVDPRDEETGFERFDPASVPPFVGCLSTEDCPINGRVFLVLGGGVHLFRPFAIANNIEKQGAGRLTRWRSKRRGLPPSNFDPGVPLYNPVTE